MQPITSGNVNTVAPYQVNEQLTVGIAAYGNAASSRRCIEAALQSLHGDFELILVDDCSPDDGETLSLFTELKKIHPNTKVISFKVNREYSGSLNAILSHAQGEQVFFLSNDIITSPSYFAMMLEAERSNQPGIYRGSSNFVDNGLESHNIKADRAIQSFYEVADVAKRMASIYGPMAFCDQYLTGDAFMVSRSVLDKIGTIDPLFYGYFADSDLGLRCQIAGFQLYLVPGSWAYHDQGTNFSYLPEELLKEKLARRWNRVIENWARFKLKYSLPVELPYTSVNDIPWQQLASQEFTVQKHYLRPGHYLDDLV